MSHVWFTRSASQFIARSLNLQPTVVVKGVKIRESRNVTNLFKRRYYQWNLESRHNFWKVNENAGKYRVLTFLFPQRGKTLLIRNLKTSKSKSGVKSEQILQHNFKKKNRTVAIYVIAVTVFVLGGSYAAVPLYRLYCQASGLGGTVKQVEADKLQNMERIPERMLTVRFNSDTSAAMQWSFKPQQSEIKLAPGETALAFYTAKNPTDVAITGISTYNVIPFEVGQYFNKIQCFCFEEQRLNPREEVDMPVFFFIDPEFTEDPAMAKIDKITLSYTFFEAKEADKLGIQSVPH